MLTAQSYFLGSLALWCDEIHHADTCMKRTLALFECLSVVAAVDVGGGVIFFPVSEFSLCIIFCLSKANFYA